MHNDWAKKGSQVDNIVTGVMQLLIRRHVDSSLGEVGFTRVTDRAAIALGLQVVIMCATQLVPGQFDNWRFFADFSQQCSDLGPEIGIQTKTSVVDVVSLVDLQGLYPLLAWQVCLEASNVFQYSSLW